MRITFKDWLFCPLTGNTIAIRLALLNILKNLEVLIVQLGIYWNGAVLVLLQKADVIHYSMVYVSVFQWRERKRIIKSPSGKGDLKHRFLLATSNLKFAQRPYDIIRGVYRCHGYIQNKSPVAYCVSLWKYITKVISQICRAELNFSWTNQI